MMIEENKPQNNMFWVQSLLTVQESYRLVGHFTKERDSFLFLLIFVCLFTSTMARN